ncbi:adenine-specific methyltransferase EcoRI family protein [Ligilactobacillus ruminis]|nr:adenine-specific methyltransferase EcoRI family protein [Ligilactobacillus ruminis]MDB7636331.1 adenine-specific methyltransferase EcoRI family protein [Ligilactobacillus ruminis]MDB7679427.1 adenine-specific methyltransferase EcoRI family protein [Ligilactobacillus ruminis]
MGNVSLIAAKKAKDDEFYTQYKDVEKELAHYRCGHCYQP